MVHQLQRGATFNVAPVSSLGTFGSCNKGKVRVDRHVWANIIDGLVNVHINEIDLLAKKK